MAWVRGWPRTDGNLIVPCQDSGAGLDGSNSKALALRKGLCMDWSALFNASGGYRN